MKHVGFIKHNHQKPVFHMRWGGILAGQDPYRTFVNRPALAMNMAPVDIKERQLAPRLAGFLEEILVGVYPLGKKAVRTRKGPRRPIAWLAYDLLDDISPGIFPRAEHYRPFTNELLWNEGEEATTTRAQRQQ